MRKVRNLAIRLLKLDDWHITSQHYAPQWRRYNRRLQGWEHREIDSSFVVPLAVHDHLRRLHSSGSETFHGPDEIALWNTEWYRFAKKNGLLDIDDGPWEDDFTKIEVSRLGCLAISLPAPSTPTSKAFSRLKSIRDRVLTALLEPMLRL